MRVRWDRAFDFSVHTSFAIAPPEEGAVPSVHPLASEAAGAHVRRAVVRELEARGLEQAGMRKADAWVRSTLSVVSVVWLDPPPHSEWLETLDPDLRWELEDDPLDEIEAERWSELRAGFETARLVVDVYDARQQRLVWRGVAEVPLRDGSRLPEVLDAAVRDLVDRYPPPRD